MFTLAMASAGVTFGAVLAVFLTALNGGRG